MTTAGEPQRPASPTRRREQLAAFYAARAGRLRRAAAAQVHTSDDTVLEDACQHAWVTLTRRADVALDDEGFGWLVTVAVREGWRLARVPRAVPSGMFRGEGDAGSLECAEPATLDGDPEASALSRERHDARVRALSRLTPLERRDLYLHALGYSYGEIAAAADTTVTSVNRHLSHGRDRLRHLMGGESRTP